ncbi:hypothetical protein Pint_05287 [Pistacia integerrima]|uniref:Uncharacterized protein n=1 Tax=Pistacia integerrima TaxID=434235 RepID=A0ACC0ZAB7_9ROSI|nr:hypothetical protein Pint_05287 [Pistacia integerrima]
MLTWLFSDPFKNRKLEAIRTIKMMILVGQMVRLMKRGMRIRSLMIPMLKMLRMMTMKMRRTITTLVSNMIPMFFQVMRHTQEQFRLLKKEKWLLDC